MDVPQVLGLLGLLHHRAGDFGFPPGWDANAATVETDEREYKKRGEIFRGTTRPCGSAHWLDWTSWLGKSATLKPPSLDLMKAGLHWALEEMQATPHHHLLTEISVSVPGRHRMTRPKWPLTSGNKPSVSRLSYRHSGLLWPNHRGGHRGLRGPWSPTVPGGESFGSFAAENEL